MYFFFLFLSHFCINTRELALLSLDKNSDPLCEYHKHMETVKHLTPEEEHIIFDRARAYNHFIHDLKNESLEKWNKLHL